MEPKRHQCPECGAPRGADNTPSCACGRRASDALRDARTTEQAAAEDFDPLRIRPYVDLDGEEASQAHPDAEVTMPLRAVEPDALPTPSVTDLRLFEAPDPDAPTPDAGPERPRNHRRTALLGAAGAVVAVVAAAGFASGLFSYETPSRDDALSQDVREAVPDARTSEASRTPSTTAPSATPTSTTPSPTTSTSPSPRPDPRRPPPRPRPSRPHPPTPRQRPEPPPPRPRHRTRREHPVLGPGDDGPEVVELQLRLRQLYLYNDEPHGHYNHRVEEAVRNYQWARGVQPDELGVYDEKTRERLESETSEP
ncbi:peptidoglycan-binding protein [Streptomyces sp. F001]|uniref:peptidoglycan-binding domain-containing protein n=1 Tax=Streptomyces sp. F001 TaxID=1510026 RepID=UPI00101E59D1|nr:peptidoglycan-binding protein [Streptomyces sp. F001]RZB16359.1 peptidoglycan-binding protein [Streptomyces sp. F001]